MVGAGTAVGRAVGRAAESVRIRGWRDSLLLTAAEVGFAVRHGVGFRRSTDSPTQTLASVSIVRWALDHMGPTEGHVLLDVGCGRGRLLLVAAERPFERLVGIETDAEMAATARRRVAGRAEVLDEDAFTWSLPDDIDRIVLCNPFWPTHATPFLDRVAESVRRSPREVLLAYVTPLDHDLLVAKGWVPADSIPDVTVYRFGGEP